MSGTKDALAELGLPMEDDSMETAEKAESTESLDPYTYSKQLERQFEFLSIQEVTCFFFCIPIPVLVA
jgi:galactitol-specific phosphotransferase system IIB component